MACGNRLWAHGKRRGAPAWPGLITGLRDGFLRTVSMARQVMEAHAKVHPPSVWACQIAGCNAVLAAGLLEIDVTRAQTAGAVWKFAGQTNEPWEKGQRRPFNALLKRNCYLLGSCFKRLSAGEKSDEEVAEALLRTDAKKAGEPPPDAKELERRLRRLDRDDALLERVQAKQARAAKRRDNLHKPEYLYVRMYAERKAEEIRRNQDGELAEQALIKLENARKQRWQITDGMRKCWEAGRLQPCGLDLRAMRHAVKMFLSHYWEVGRHLAGLPIPNPWALEHGGHVHYIPPPCRTPPEKTNGKPRRRAAALAGV